MQYNYKSAQSHAREGLKFVEELKEKRANEARSTPQAVVEDELIDQFNRLDLQIMIMYDSRNSNSLHSKMKDEGSLLIKNMPAVFTEVNTARQYLELISRRTYHFIGYAVANQTSRFRFAENASPVDPDDKLS